MLGRIIKQNNIFYCLIDDKMHSLELDVKDKINNGDLIQINECQPNDIIKRSSISVLKRLPLKTKIPALTEMSPLHKRLKNRILDLRSSTNHSTFIFRSEINKILANLFNSNDYVNMNTPLIVGSVTEGRVNTFKVDFFGHEASLTMTKLVYLRYLICSDFKKVYDLSPVFVGGKHKTLNHVSEYYTLDWATSEQIDFNEHLQYVDTILSELITKLSQFVKRSNLKINFKFGLLLEEIKDIKILNYTEVMDTYIKTYPEDKDVLKQFHIPARIISFAHNRYGKCFWIVEFPEQFKQFYCDTLRRGNRNVVLSSELWWNNIKIASISFSNSDYQKTFNRIKMLGLNPNNFKTYLKAISLASAEAYLGSLYIERLMMVFLNIDNIKEAQLFPRAQQGAILDP